MKQVIFLLMCVIAFFALHAQNAVLNDSVGLLPIDSGNAAKINREWSLVISSNNILNTTATPFSQPVVYKVVHSRESMFYLLSGLLLWLGILKLIYNRYFTNLFKVFFNTSLRQGQLTDQLLQAKLPSLLFNAFFVVSGGIYTFLVLLHYQWVNDKYRWQVISICTGLLAFIYLSKFCVLRFTGWITGLKEITNTYLFIVFLINKIVGVFLIPFIVAMAFSSAAIANIAVLFSLLIIGCFFVLRFFKSYGLLFKQLKISHFHFVLYIAATEILPLLLIYKVLLLLLSKNL